MASPVTALILGVTLFAATNIDDIFMLLGFFSDPRFRPYQVVIGQYLGFSALVLISLAAALVAFAIPRTYVGLLGLAPITIGCMRLADLRRGREDELRPPAASATRGRVLSVAVVTFSNGGDNIGTYTPLFAIRSGGETAVILAVFAVMTAVWCAIAHGLVHHRTIGKPIRRYGHGILPFVLIGIGLLIMLEAGTFELLRDLVRA